ncbi:hypothetical protein BH18CHL1_BH18CHL1_03070 [soil metagenome]
MRGAPERDLRTSLTQDESQQPPASEPNQLVSWPEYRAVRASTVDREEYSPNAALRRYHGDR